VQQHDIAIYGHEADMMVIRYKQESRSYASQIKRYQASYMARKVTDLVKTEVSVHNSRIATLELKITINRNANMTMQYI